MLLAIDEKAEVIHELKVAEAPRGEITCYWLQIVRDGMGVPIRIPVIVARGRKDGKVLGLTAAVHGNELNGIPVIQRLFTQIDIDELEGTIVGYPSLMLPP